MRTTNSALLLATAALCSLTACASDPRLGPDGRAGYVSEFYSAAKLRSDPPRCLATLTPAEVAAGTYVEIKIWHGRRGEYLSALVPDSIKPALHDKVEISPPSCTDGVVPVVRQILSGSTPPPDYPAKGPLPQGKKGQ